MNFDAWNKPKSKQVREFSLTSPWAFEKHGGVMAVIDSTTRLEKIREMDAEQLKAVVAWPHNQSEVLRRAKQRLMKLERAGSKNNPWLTVGKWNGYPTTNLPITIEARLKLVAKFDLEKLLLVIRWSGTQDVVRTAAQRRAREIQRSLKSRIAAKLEDMRGIAAGLL